MRPRSVVKEKASGALSTCSNTHKDAERERAVHGGSRRSERGGGAGTVESGGAGTVEIARAPP